MRTRLVERIRREPVVAVIAPGGFGKTSLLASLAIELDRPIATASVGEGDGDATSRLVAAIADALAVAGIGDAAEAVRSAPADAAADEVVRVLVDRPELLLVVDDAHRLDDAGWAWVWALSERIGGRALPSMVVAARPSPDRSVVPSGVAVLGADDLRFDPDDLVRVVGVGVGSATVGRVLELTEGWPVAVGLLVDRLAPSSLRLDRLPVHSAHAVVEYVVDEAVESLTDDLAVALGHLVRLPLWSTEIVDQWCGQGSLVALTRSGLPVVEGPDGWWRVADPVRDLIASKGSDGGTIPVSLAAIAARHYLDHGDVVATLSLCAVGGAAPVAAALARVRWQDLARAGLATVRVLVDSLGPSVLAASPEILVACARVAEPTDPPTRDRWLAMADSATTAPGHPLRPVVLAELACAAAAGGAVDLAASLGRDALALAASDDGATRGRALMALGHAGTIRCTPSALAAARADLEQALVLFRLHRERAWEWQTLLRLGYAVSFHGGHVTAAAEQVGGVVALLGAPGRDRAVVLTYYADVLDTLGRQAEALAACDEAATIAHRLGDPTLSWFAEWARMLVVSHGGDASATRRCADAATESLATWAGTPRAAEFGSAVVDALCCAGDLDEAARRWPDVRAELARHGLADAERVVAARVEATFGDPTEAERLLAMLLDGDERSFAVVRTDWVRWLLRARAAQRRGDDDAASRHVVSARSVLAAIDAADLAERHEGRLVEALGPLWGRSSSVERRRLRVLGTFEFDVDGIDATPPEGHPATIVKLLALRGAMPVDVIIDRCWPDADATTGRSRLRNTLHRLRSRSGEIVERRGDLLRLADDIDVDLVVFDRLADAALGAPASQRAGAARLAAASCPGSLLPGDVYEDWTIAERERVDRRRVGLYDAIVADAIERGDVDEAVSFLERAHDLDPVDELRLVRAAELLAAVGSTLMARRCAHRARRIVDELGIDADRRLVELEARLGR